MIIYICTETYLKIPDEQMKRTKKDRKDTARTAGLKKRGSFSYTITIKKYPFFFYCAVAP
jgi:hypothetical protein